MTKRKKVWITIGILVPILVIAIFYIQGDILYRLDRVNEGLASPEFPYRDYTVEELGKLYPQEHPFADVITTRSPEETHALFISKMKTGDFEGAVECCFKKGDQQEMLNLFNKLDKEGTLESSLKEIENIEKDWMSDTHAVYNYMTSYKGFIFKSGIRLNKNSQGVWLMEKL